MSSYYQHNWYEDPCVKNIKSAKCLSVISITCNFSPQHWKAKASLLFPGCWVNTVFSTLHRKTGNLVRIWWRANWTKVTEAMTCFKCGWADEVTQWGHNCMASECWNSTTNMSSSITKHPATTSQSLIFWMASLHFFAANVNLLYSPLSACNWIRQYKNQPSSICQGLGNYTTKTAWLTFLELNL